MERIIGNDGSNADRAMGSFGRITALADLPNDKTLVRYVQEAAKLNESGAPARPRPTGAAAKKDIPVPDAFAAALRKNKAATETFEAFSPSHRREYVEWITEAKREETRATRIATAIEWLGAGKARNWKYQK